MFWQILPSKKVDEVGDTVSGSIGPTQLGSVTLSLTKNLPHSKFYLHQMAISLSSLSRQEKRWLLRRSTENQATIKTEHAKSQHTITGRFNFQGMQNVIDLMDSDNKISAPADSHVLWFTSRAPGLNVTQSWEAGSALWCHHVTPWLLVSVCPALLTFLHRHHWHHWSALIMNHCPPCSCHHRSWSLRWVSSQLTQWKQQNKQGIPPVLKNRIYKAWFKDLKTGHKFEINFK